LSHYSFEGLLLGLELREPPLLAPDEPELLDPPLLLEPPDGEDDDPRLIVEPDGR
jgi:hypothetical protein